jgi:Sporulation delaying protein SdpA
VTLGFRRGSAGVSGSAQAPDTPASSSAFALTLAALGSLLLLTLAAQVLPASATPAWLRIHRADYHMIWPQSWSFFANTADSETLAAYHLESGRRLGPPAIGLSMSGMNAWGLGRTAAAELDDAFYLQSQIPAGYWVACAGRRALATCVNRARTYVLADRLRPAMLCGLVAFVRAPPSARRQPGRPGPASVAVARLACTG